MVAFEPVDLTLANAKPTYRLPDDWFPILEHSCQFGSEVFAENANYLIKNPNVNSSLLFRADILYDSLGEEVTESHYTEISNEAEAAALSKRFGAQPSDFPGFEIERTFIRCMIPRNPQLDKPISQTCQILRHAGVEGQVTTLVLYVPHVSSVEELPWYHPRVRALAYLHNWQPWNERVLKYWDSTKPCVEGNISLHYRLFPQHTFPLSLRLHRTSYQLLQTVYKHGQGSLHGCEKRVHHDQLVSQQRVQDTYTDLKRKHSKRLCDNWVEKTEPSKHVFEDLSIAAFLIELWKDMYPENEASDGSTGMSKDEGLPPFPRFVDIGCGNGVLVDVLLREGYKGWGFDAHKRKTWATFEPWVQECLKQLVLIPQPLFELHSPSKSANGGILSHLSLPSRVPFTRSEDFPPIWHNGLFPTGTFIISNHADELTSWTPLLASISSSPFLAIPCCSHNLSGAKFRAPSVFNNNMADHLAPSYFANNIQKSKSVAITVACLTAVEDQQPKKGNLEDLSIKNRSNQPSAYSSLCDWVCHLTASVGYIVEVEMLRLPSTRNSGIVARTLASGFEREGWEERMQRVIRIATKEGADGAMWVERTKGLMAGKGAVH